MNIVNSLYDYIIGSEDDNETGFGIMKYDLFPDGLFDQENKRILCHILSDRNWNAYNRSLSKFNRYSSINKLSNLEHCDYDNNQLLNKSLTNIFRILKVSDYEDQMTIKICIGYHLPNLSYNTRPLYDNEVDGTFELYTPPDSY